MVDIDAIQEDITGVSIPGWQRKYMEDMIAELQRLRELTTPRPIETAPKDGKWILLRWPAVTDVPFVGYMVDGVWHAATAGDTWPDLDGPNAWWPLPEQTQETK